MARGSGYKGNIRQDVLATEREARRRQGRLKRPGTAKAGGGQRGNRAAAGRGADWARGGAVPGSRTIREESLLLISGRPRL